MIKIQPEAIDLVLLETTTAKLAGKSQELTSRVENKMKLEKPYLYRYLRQNLKSLGGYELGANITYSIIEEQLKFSQKQSPKITERDLRESKKSLGGLMKLETDSTSYEKFRKILQENRDFADCITAFARKAPDLARAGGFIVGAVAVYYAYEQALAFQR